MRGVNVWVGAGNLGKDPEVKYLPSGMQVASFSLAMSEKWKPKDGGPAKEKTTWMNIVCFASLAENVSKYVGKGDEVMIVGKISVRHWDDKDGNKRTAWEIVAKEVHFLKTSKKEFHGEAGTGGHDEPGVYSDEEVPF